MAGQRSRGLVAAGLIAGFSAVPAQADDFLAMPGLWVTTLLSQANAGHPEKRTDWHCVDDEIDPWTSFIPASDHPDMQCMRTTSQRTSTSLRWHLECSGHSTTASDGELHFDSAQHYAGSIIETRQVDGRPQQRRIDVEGRRRAACTTPED